MTDRSRAKPASNDDVWAVVPLLRVSEMQRSLQYYVAGVGFSIKEKWEVDGKVRWCLLARGGAALMLQEFPKRGHNAWTPAGKVGEGVALYFNCTDALSIYHEATARGLEVTEPQVGNSKWEIFLTDPDGYAVNFTSPTDVPEETKLWAYQS